MCTVSCAFITALLDRALTAGLDTEAVLRRASISPSEISHPDQRIARDRQLALWDEIEREIGEDAGVWVATGIETPALGPAGLLSSSRPRLGDAIRSLAAHARSIDGAWRIEIVDDMDEVEVRQEFRSGVNGHSRRLESPARLDEMYLAMIVALGRRWTGRAWVPEQVTFPHPAPRDPHPHVEVFGSAVTFRAVTTSLSIAREIWDLPLETADPALARQLEQAAADRATDADGDDLVERVEREVRMLMQEENLDLDTVSRRVGMSKRTLQRRLNERGLVFRDVVDGIRRDLAQALIRDPSFSVEDIACTLGYTDARPFRTAFRRWFGASPTSYRKEQSIEA